ncbi:uncharacterized protein LOC124165293 [Ischnura elegans]|uniref:uncharacterized protein LOC124165293 n=1 Tax=Ischnura elegans TaxID=197161 RepID=UPI001ED879CA|nr:uncharacterized protein LOC124165293 [Ischnura elegans]
MEERSRLLKEVIGITFFREVRPLNSRGKLSDTLANMKNFLILLLLGMVVLAECTPYRRMDYIGDNNLQDGIDHRDRQPTNQHERKVRSSDPQFSGDADVSLAHLLHKFLGRPHHDSEKTAMETVNQREKKDLADVGNWIWQGIVGIWNLLM